MRFFQHPMKPEWGLGVVAAEDPSSLNLLFEGIGYGAQCSKHSADNIRAVEMELSRIRILPVTVTGAGGGEHRAHVPMLAEGSRRQSPSKIFETS